MHSTEGGMNLSEKVVFSAKGQPALDVNDLGAQLKLQALVEGSVGDGSHALPLHIRVRCR